MAPSIAYFASDRVSTMPASTTPWYRSACRPAAAMAPSPDIAASTRGSSWAASATTSFHPGSARTAARMLAGSCSAPPPLVAHRPVTTPPGT